MLRTRSITLFLAFLVCTWSGAEPATLERLQRELKVAAPPEHYPDHAEYRLFPKVCNPKVCFIVLAAQFDSVLGPTLRLAVFSESEHYLGSYVGLRSMPSGVDGFVLRFPPPGYGNAIRFERTSPPPEIRIDGQYYSFQRAR